MTHRGRVENGQIVLDSGAALPEGANVEVRVVESNNPQLPQKNPDLAKYFGIADDLPANSSVSIDQVLYGARPE
jgi:hypothetical protein